jgi:hypothetical protein
MELTAATKDKETHSFEIDPPQAFLLLILWSIISQLQIIDVSQQIFGLGMEETRHT